METLPSAPPWEKTERAFFSFWLVGGRMMRRALGLSVVGCGLVLIAACSADETPSAKYPTTDSFCAAKAAEECKLVFAACVVSEDQCKTARANACNTAAGQATSQ